LTERVGGNVKGIATHGRSEEEKKEGKEKVESKKAAKGDQLSRRGKREARGHLG